MAPRPATLTRVPLPMRGGALQGEVISFSHLPDGKEHIAISFLKTDRKKSSQDNPPPLVRVHSECLTGDVFQSARCDCGPQLDEALEKCAADGGVILYLRQEGRGVGLYTKLASYALQDKGLDTFEANRQLNHKEDERDYLAAAKMLEALGLRTIKLLTNNPKKAERLEELGIHIHEVVPTKAYINPHNRKYLLSKKEKAGHTLELENVP